MFGNYECFKKDVFDLTKIDLSSYKERQMKRRIEALIKKNGFDRYDAYVKLLVSNQEKLEHFVRHITINVSEFYRNPNQWKVMEDIILPHLMEKRGRRLRIWSSACSTGEEPYTVIMLLMKHYPQLVSQIEVIATDIDKQALKKAEAGLYHEKSLKNLPKDMVQSFFLPLEQHMYQITDIVKSHVEFGWNNLLEDEYPGNVDLILCRNVLIYFTEEAKNQIYEKFSDSQPKDGILFIGSTEQILQPDQFGYESFRSFYYVKK